MLEQILHSLAVSLLLTVAVELLLALLLGVRGTRNLLLVFLVNLITNPLVGILLDVYYVYVAMPPWYCIAALELSAVAAEWMLYRGRLEYRRISPLTLSLLLNAASYGAGLLLTLIR